MTETDFNTRVLLVIGFAAVVTYLLRFGGLMLADKLPGSGRWKRFMDALPGTILLSLIAPEIVSAGWWGGIGALATAFCAYITGSTFLSMLVGVVIVALHRHF